MQLSQSIDAYMSYCHSRQLRQKTMMSYEQTLRLFERFLLDGGHKTTIKDITQHVIQDYIIDLQERGKYTMYANPMQTVKNCPERRRDYRATISNATINNYLRNMKAFFHWLEEIGHISRSPMIRIRYLPQV